jgi:CheY-like chemotaxis protein
LEFRLQLGDDHDQVLIDPGQLEIGLFNLVMNATDALRDRVGGVLTVAVSTIELSTSDTAFQELAPGRYVKITVIDNGAGMSEEVRARAFEPFFTTKDVGEGPGLGLSQTYGLVRQFNGAITLNSTPGVGTTATIYLPVVAPAGRPVQSEDMAVDASQQRSQSYANSRILVVEDDVLVREFVVQTLRSLGYEVLDAKNGDVGWEVLQNAGPFDLLCTDIVMPGTLNGLRLAEKGRANQPNLRIIYMSGYTGKALDGAVPFDVIPYLAKPFTGAELAASVERVLTGVGA